MQPPNLSILLNIWTAPIKRFTNAWMVHLMLFEMPDLTLKSHIIQVWDDLEFACFYLSTQMDFSYLEYSSAAYGKPTKPSRKLPQLGNMKYSAKMPHFLLVTGCPKKKSFFKNPFFYFKFCNISHKHVS